jgi:hypothetical protein
LLWRNNIKKFKTSEMKKKIFIPGMLSLSLLAFTLTSCEDEKPLSELIIGKWDVQTVRIVDYQNDVKKSEILYYLEADEMAIQFADGGTGISYENGDVYGLFDWSLNGSTLVLGTDMEWTITIDGDTLIWSYTETEVIDTVTHRYEYFFTAQRSA